MRPAHSDHFRYLRFAGPRRVETAANTLIGLLEGVLADKRLVGPEVDRLASWCEQFLDVRDRHPFCELVDAVENALADGVLTSEEREDLLWLARNIESGRSFDKITADMQKLHGLLAGIAADGTITSDELLHLDQWLGEHDHLKTVWPYDELESIIVKIRSTQTIEPALHSALIGFFSQFTNRGDDRTLDEFDAAVLHIGAVCSTCPEIVFAERRFCITGASSRMSRNELSARIIDAGGFVTEVPNKKTDFLIVGAEGNPCWTYACYGRKVEKAILLRKTGHPIAIVFENDLHDALADL